MAENVLFRIGTYEQYSALEPKLDNTLYFTSDTLQLFKGSKEYSKPVHIVEELPDSGDLGVEYLRTTDTTLHIWDGAKFAQVVFPKATSISSSPTDEKIATEKAVADAIKASGAFVNVEYNTDAEDANKLVFTTSDGSQKTIDIAKDNFLSAANLNEETGELELTMSNGSVVKVPVSDLVVSELNSDKVKTAKEITVKGQTIGSYTDGSVIPKGTTLTEVLTKMAAKQIPPTYKAPTSTLSPANQAVETGTSVTPTIKSVFTKNDAGDVTSYKVTRTLSGSPTEIKTGAAVEDVTDAAQIVPDGANLKYTVEIGYGDGPVKDDNLGNPYPSTAIKAGTLSKSMTYTGQRKRFHSVGTGAIPELTSDAIRGMTGVLNPTAGQTFDISLAVGSKNVVIAIPTGRSIKQIMYVETNDTGMLPNFATQTVKVADARGGSNGLMDYTVYTYEMAGAAQAVMTFRVTLQ